MNQGFSIRCESPSDTEAIAEVTTAAFLTAPHSSHAEQFIVAKLRQARALSLSLVAEIESQVIGHIAFSPVIIADGSTGWYGLGPLSVAPLFQRRGVGQTLVQTGLKRLRERGARGCVVLGSPEYYRRFGFASTSHLIFPGAPPMCFMSLSFTGFDPRGEVVYHEAFNAFA